VFCSIALFLLRLIFVASLRHEHHSRVKKNYSRGVFTVTHHCCFRHHSSLLLLRSHRHHGFFFNFFMLYFSLTMSDAF
jgi:hypothetical protein